MYSVSFYFPIEPLYIHNIWEPTRFSSVVKVQSYDVRANGLQQHWHPFKISWGIKMHKDSNETKLLAPICAI